MLFFQLLGSGCLVVVVLTHLCEVLHVFSWMHWGSSTAPGTILISGVLFLVSLCFLEVICSAATKQRT